MKGVLTFFVFLFMLGSVQALTTPTPDITIAVERGADYNFALVIQNIENTTQTITFTSPSNWVTFEGDLNYTTNILPHIPTYVNIKVSVPSGTPIGSYSTQINANNVKLSDLTIKVTLPVSEAESLQALANVKAEISKLKSDLEYMINSLKSNLTKRIDEIEEYKLKYETASEEKTELETKVNELQERIYELESRATSLEAEKEQLGEVTGRLVSGQPTIFAIGFLVGLGVFYVFVKKRKYLRLLKIGKLKIKAKETEEKAKYSFKPK